MPLISLERSRRVSWEETSPQASPAFCRVDARSTQTKFLVQSSVVRMDSPLSHYPSHRDRMNWRSRHDNRPESRRRQLKLDPPVILKDHEWQAPLACARCQGFLGNQLAKFLGGCPASPVTLAQKKSLPLKDCYRLIEPGPVVLISTAWDE